VYVIDHHALKQLYQILRLLPSLKVIAAGSGKTQNLSCSCPSRARITAMRPHHLCGQGLLEFHHTHLRG
jgi:hypothetical protein